MINFSDQHASNLRSLLESTPLIARLTELRPKIEGRTLEDKAMSAAVVEGYEACIAEIENLAAQVSLPQESRPYIQNLHEFENRPAQQPT